MSVPVLGMRMHPCTKMCTISKRDAVECYEGAREERVQEKDKRFLRKSNPRSFQAIHEGLIYLVSQSSSLVVYEAYRKY